MADEAGAETIPALRRKAIGGRVPPPPEPTEPLPARALRRGLARAAEADCGLPLAAGQLRLREVSLAELLELPEPMSLFAVLEGPGERLGLCAFAPEMLAAVIEQQTTGAVLPVAGTPRRPTRTDAAMCARLIDRTLAELEAGLAGTPDLAWAGGYRYASFLDDARPLGLLLEDIPYRVFAVTVGFASGARRGTVLLALPAEPFTRRPGLVRPGAAADPAAADAADAAEPPADPVAAAWAARMETAVLTSPAQLDGVIERLRVPLAAVLRWQTGDLVVLPNAALDAVTIEGAGGRTLARARLGQARGQRALRLLPPGEEGAADVADALPDLSDLPDL